MNRDYEKKLKEVEEQKSFLRMDLFILAKIEVHLSEIARLMYEQAVVTMGNTSNVKGGSGEEEAIKNPPSRKSKKQV